MIFFGVELEPTINKTKFNYFLIVKNHRICQNLLLKYVFTSFVFLNIF